MHFAQTNIQLYNQMFQAGYSAKDVRLVADAYLLSTEIFVGKYRGSGKTLLAHLVGTASITAWCGRPAASVAAGLLHAAYEDGDFGRLNGRATVHAALGASVEALVWAYHSFRWSYSAEQIDGVLAQTGEMSPVEREAVLLRVINELEDYIDIATHYHGTVDGSEVKGAIWRLDYMNVIEEPLRKLALNLDEPMLAEEIDNRFEEVRRATVPAEVRSGHPYMWSRAPLSYRRTLGGHCREVARFARRIKAKGTLGVLRVVIHRVRLKGQSI